MNTPVTIEIFSTNVTDHRKAAELLEYIHHSFSTYSANFDLHDCDNILRIECSEGNLQPMQVISLLKRFGYDAFVLPDTGID